ncbi:MAG TPA: hypothetical protein VGO89_10150, partial [Streptomyces sp.]|nr:hypothetical protein [Streptomyces sp.]
RISSWMSVSPSVCCNLLIGGTPSGSGRVAYSRVSRLPASRESPDTRCDTGHPYAVAWLTPVLR